MYELSKADLMEIEILSELGNLIVKLQSEIKEIEREIESLYNKQSGTLH